MNDRNAWQKLQQLITVRRAALAQPSVKLCDTCAHLLYEKDTGAPTMSVNIVTPLVCEVCGDTWVDRMPRAAQEEEHDR